MRFRAFANCGNSGDAGLGKTRRAGRASLRELHSCLSGFVRVVARVFATHSRTLGGGGMKRLRQISSWVTIAALVIPSSVLDRAAAASAAPTESGAVAALSSYSEPGISPDGMEIAFVSGGDIWTVPAAGGEARLLISHPATESRPLYSPDGKRLAFVSN